MRNDASSPLRLFDPESEPYTEWAEQMAHFREKLKAVWKVNRAPQSTPWRGVERRKKPR
jgi:hypothetical protein